MSGSLYVVLQCPLELGELVAEVELSGGQKRLILIEGGRFRGELPAPALRLKLTPLAAAAAEQRSSAEPPAAGTFVSAAIEDLFEKGVAIPADGRLTLALTWGVHCHSSMNVPSTESTSSDAAHGATRGVRFGSFEHITCANFVGKNDFGKTLVFNNIEASFDKDMYLRVGNKKLTFGEILALAGDYYAHLDATAAKEFAWAWPPPSGLTVLLNYDYRGPTLREDDDAITAAILAAVDETREKGSDALDAKTNLLKLGLTTDYPVRRYLALASQNHCHFAGQPATGKPDDSVNEALRLYRAYHQRALKEAEAARGRNDVPAFFQALVVDAFGCHFLSDLFATGHMRVPRRILSEHYGVIKGALGMAHDFHCEDNGGGLWLTTRYRQPGAPRTVWRGYGDDRLHKPESGFHFLMVRRAVARSAAEVFARYCNVVLPEGQRAEDLVPMALAAGSAPLPGDLLPDHSPAPHDHPNSYPLYWWLADKQILARRAGPPTDNQYVDQDKPHNPPFRLP